MNERVSRKGWRVAYLGAAMVLFLAEWSRNDPLRTADSTPRGKATNRAKTRLNSASQMVAGSRSSTMPVTG